MQSKELFLDGNLVINWKNAFLQEVNLIWQFIGRDYSTTILPPLLFVVASWNTHPSSIGELLLALGKGLIYFWLYAFAFCLSNQIVGIDEDRINKPDRPLVIGLVSYQGAQVRWAIAMGLFSLFGWWFGVLEWALLWQACIILNNFGGWAKHWLGKNTIMGVGTMAQLAAAWQLVMPINSIGWHWILLVAILVIPVVAVQDLRDIDGDRAIGRNTLPIAIGETASRIILCIGFILLPLAIHFGLMIPAGDSFNALFWDVLLAAGSLLIAWRVVKYSSPQADRQTYMFFTYGYCLVLGSAIFVL